MQPKIGKFSRLVRSHNDVKTPNNQRARALGDHGRSLSWVVRVSLSYLKTVFFLFEKNGRKKHIILIKNFRANFFV